MVLLPEGTLTFLLTDLESSTRAWEAQPQAMRAAMEQHDEIVQQAVDAHAGIQVEAGREGDSVLAVFRTATDGAACALALQRGFAAAAWPEGLRLAIRVSLHTGEAQLRGAHYFGLALNRCARLLALCHGGQVLVSMATRQVLGDAPPAGSQLLDLGLHRLKDLSRPEHVFQLVDLERPVEFPPLRSVRGRPSNLPVQLTRLIGRREDLLELARLQAESRLLTITGPGGVGKTRLAVELASQLVGAMTDGVWFVDLAVVTDAAQLPRAVASALDLEEQTGRPVLDTLVEHCAERELLLVLDNCEHLVEAGARVAEALLRAGPDVKILATSREALRVPGETVWRVPALAIPDATRLFADRARARQPDFDLTEANAIAVNAICEQLDRMPLAIELAAAQVAMMPVAEVAARLQQGLPLLGGGSRTATARQQTLEALIEWSHRLLEPRQALLFRRLSVFAGDFALSAAEDVCSELDVPRDQVAYVLSELVAKSLVQPAEGRYRLLDTIRAFAQARLAAAGELEAVRSRHAGHFLEVAGSWAPGQRAAWLDRLEADHDNLRAALRWATAADPVLALRLASALYDFWYLRGYVIEGREYLERLLPRLPPDAPGWRRGILDTAGLAYVAGDLQRAQALLEQALAAARLAEDRESLARGLVYAGAIGVAEGRAAEAEAALTEALQLGRQEGYPRVEAEALHQLGVLASLRPDLAAMRGLLEESLAVRRAMGCADESNTTLTFLAAAAMLGGDAAAARSAIQEALEVGFALRDRRAAWSLDVLACLDAQEGRAEQALRLGGAAAAMFDATGQQPPGGWRAFTEPILARARAALAGEAAAQAWQAGRELGFDEALAYALEAEELTV
ncbi:MAG TPA: AAA family ATPase [Candidatus Dormibacteraeota bacterium]